MLSLWPTGHFDDRPDLPIWDNNVLLSSMGAPLDRFEGVDLADVRSVALVFDATDSGAIFITDLEFLRSDK